MASSSSSQKIILKSSDDELFYVDAKVAMLSLTIKNMVEDIGHNNGVVPLTIVTSKTLTKVIEYCNKHATYETKCNDETNLNPDVESELNIWDEQFIKLDNNTLFDVILAANYLDIRGLFELSIQYVADAIKDKSPEEVREIFNIINDFTPEEEAEIRKDNEWAFHN